MRSITSERVRKYQDHLIETERSATTVQKYIGEIKKFSVWLGERELTKCAVLQYKEEISRTLAPASVNAALCALNVFFQFCKWYGLRVKTVKIQRQIFASEDRELTRAEYERLLQAASRKSSKRLYLLMQTICATGIRVSELRHITVEAVERGRAEIQCKGKRRTVLLPRTLCAALKRYIKEKGIKKGPVFITRNGKPMDRSNIWSDMKKLCKSANVSQKKVFPHNLRHLFARTYYSAQKDIVRLADILGHASVNTTRIYTVESGAVHRRQIERLGLLRC